MPGERIIAGVSIGVTAVGAKLVSVARGGGGRVRCVSTISGVVRPSASSSWSPERESQRPLTPIAVAASSRECTGNAMTPAAIASTAMGSP